MTRETYNVIGWTILCGVAMVIAGLLLMVARKTKNTSTRDGQIAASIALLGMMLVLLGPIGWMMWGDALFPAEKTNVDVKK